MGETVLVTSGEWFWVPRVLGGPMGGSGSWVRAGLGVLGPRCKAVPGFVWGLVLGLGWGAVPTGREVAGQGCCLRSGPRRPG